MNHPEHLDGLIQELGDIAHKKYLGCHNEVGTWHYSYSDEVINILDTQEAREAILTWVEKDVIGEDEEGYTDHWGDYHNVTSDGQNSRNALRAEQRQRLRAVRQEGKK